MKLLLFRSLWTNGFDLSAAIRDCATGPYDGVEGPLPDDANEARAFIARLNESKFPFIAEITTGGSYVPDRQASPEQHLDDLRRKASAAVDASPIAFTVLAGCDAWPLSQSVDFFGRALEIARGLGVPMSFETHRSRSTFHPWITRDLLLALPALRLTCDFSHWCCVCERLLDSEPDVMTLCFQCAQHIHGRVGYEQGPQVPHPEAPEHAAALAAHERWWSAIWEAQRATGQAHTTLTPEFGPDGYLQCRPFTREPVASLDEINRWMAERQRSRFVSSIPIPFA